MRRYFLPLTLVVLTAVVAAQAPAAKPPIPTDGYNIHVLAPHLVDGKVMGPYHHYCKVLSPEPVIACMIFESTDANAMPVQMEYIVAKSITRKKVPLAAWNKNWHDHAVEIAGGRVKVLDMPDADAKKVADLVATTDGYIVHVGFKDMLPDGHIALAQAVGHKPMTAKDYKASAEPPAKK